MTQTADITAEAEALIERLSALAADAESNDDHGVKEACVKAAATLRTLLESNKALMRERTNPIETKREQIGRLNTRIAALERERDQLRDKLHCMCGSPIDHSAWEGHTPVSVYDYSLDQERFRAEDAEARLAEALKALTEVRRRARNIWGACSSDQIIDKDVKRQAKLMLEYIDAARACLNKKEKSHD